MAIKVGEKAPEFEGANQKGERVSLKALLQKGPVVLYFYPKDETPGCTAEACSFRDAYEDFTAAGAEVVGVSADSVDSHQAFAAHHRLPFTLLSDESGELRKLYDVPRSFLGLLPGRVTFVIGKDGIVRHVFNSQINATKHVKEALQQLRGMGGRPGEASAGLS